MIKIKKWLSKLGYREWVMIKCEYKPHNLILTYQCQITDEVKRVVTSYED